MKKTMKRALALAAALCCTLSLGTTMAYASGNEEWGLIPDDYVLVIPASGGPAAPSTRPEQPPRPVQTPEPPVWVESGTDTEDIPPASGGGSEESADAYTLEEFAALHLQEVNRIREEYGLPVLETDSTLTQMAQERMEEYRWVHKRADGSEWYTIFGEYDTTLKAAGENWVAASADPVNQIEAFLSSDTHKANMLNEEARYLGIGVQWNDEHTAISVIQLYAK